MVRLLGLTIGEPDELPREITRTNPTNERIGENGWLIRFFDSAFFCEWIAVSYLYKHDHPGVRDYLCNRMYALPLSGIESYLFQICYLMVHKPSPSLDKFVIDICSKSLKIALKVHWFLMAEIEDADDNEGISRIQEKCQIAATLIGEWPPLIRPHNEPFSFGGKNQVLNKILSSKQRLLSLTSSPPTQRSLLLSHSSASNLGDEGGKMSPDEHNKIFKKFIPGPKVRDVLLFRKSAEKDNEDSDKDGFFGRLLRDSRDEDEELTSSAEGFFKRMFCDSRNDSNERSVSRSMEDDEKDGFFRKLFKEKFEDKKEGNLRNDEEEKDGPARKSVDYEENDGFFRKFFKDKFEDKKDGNERNREEEKDGSSRKSVEDEEKDGFFRKFFKEKFEDKKYGNERNEKEEKIGAKTIKDDEKEGFLRKLFKEKIEERKDGKDRRDDEDDEKGFFRKFLKERFEDKKDGHDGMDDEEKVYVNGEEEEPSVFPMLRKLFRVHPEEVKVAEAGRNVFESSPGTENFFRKLFRDRDRSVEDSELFGSKKQREEHPGSPKQRNEKTNIKPPLLNSGAAQFRKGAYHESLDFVQSLCDTSYGLVDIFPMEDRKSALCESLAEMNSHLVEAQNSGGVCFPMGRGLYRVLHIPEDEAVLLNSREKAPYLICVEVLKCETPSNIKDSSNSPKLSRGGIPLANGDALLRRPPPWACPLWTFHGGYHNNDKMSGSTSQAIDQAMGHFREAKVKFVNSTLSVEEQFCSQAYHGGNSIPTTEQSNDQEWVRVVLTADPGLSLEDIEDPIPSRRKEHRRVPSTIAMEEVMAAAAKGEAPPGLPLKGAGQDSSDAQPKVDPPKPTDALSGELWEVKKDRIRKVSVYGKLHGWDLCSVIVKSGDDCRQEHLAVQLISHFYDIFQEAGLPLWLRPYEVLVTSSYTALIETIPDTASIHSIKSRYPNITSLREFFNAKYQENSPSFKLAQRNFVESMAGYSLVCYLLQVKDRHNGNVLLDEDGHIIHIDFGFMLSNSPGGVSFESAPFKLTRELLEVMDSDAEGVPSEFFDYFKVLCIQGFLTCRKHAERIILLVEMLQDSGFPCFKGGPRTIQNLRKRFHLSLTEEQCVSLVLSLISSSLDAWRTRQYDYYQRVLNGIL
ncbi:Phosphatidylinositol 4-kinase beta 1 [Ancistrocladus abbreviatus]